MSPDLVDRLGYFLLGVFLGLIVGYIKGQLKAQERILGVSDKRSIKSKLSAMPREFTGKFALLVVVVVSLYASFVSQVSSNETDDNSEKLAQIQHAMNQNLTCTTQVLFDAIEALNERTTYGAAQTDANIKLQEEQLKFLSSFLTEPPPTGAQTLEAFKLYVAQERAFLELANKTRSKQIQNPYPTADDLTSCLNGRSGVEEPKK